MYLEIMDKIRDLLNPLLEEMQLQLVDLTVRRQGQDFFAEIFVDHPCGGITLDECSVLNRRLNDRMDQENLITDNYFIEVSSPGLDRPLKTKEDFLRVMGRNVHFYLADLIENKREHTGVIKDVQEARVLVDASGKDIFIPLESINKALQVISH